MIEKLKTAFWFGCRPNHWAHGTALAWRKLKTNYDKPELRTQAREWAAAQAVPAKDCLVRIGIAEASTGMHAELVAEAEARATHANVKMGGAGDINLLFDVVSMTHATRVVETGVAYGWSSLAILAALKAREGARLISVDMPYPKMGNEADVGIVVPDRLREPWVLIREPDRNGLRKAIRKVGGAIDVCHYDSDKSWWGRSYAYPILWDALRPGGVFISDDIQDNLYFSKFVAQKSAPFAVAECQGKFVGIIKKPA